MPQPADRAKSQLRDPAPSSEAVQGQRRQDRPVGPVRLRAGDLSPQHRDLMTENHDLRILGRLAGGQQHPPAKDPDHDQVEQAKGHRPRSCRNQLIRPNRRSQYLRRVLRRYRHAARAVGRRQRPASALGARPCARRPTASVPLIIQAHPVRSARCCAEPSSSIRQLTPTVLAYGHRLLRMVLLRRTCSPARRFPDSKTTALGLLD